MNDKVNELVVNLRVVLMNVTFVEQDIERSDIGTFYLSESGLQKILESLKYADLALIHRGIPYIGNEQDEKARIQVLPVIPLAEALKGKPGVQKARPHMSSWHC